MNNRLIEVSQLNHDVKIKKFAATLFRRGSAAGRSQVAMQRKHSIPVSHKIISVHAFNRSHATSGTVALLEDGNVIKAIWKVGKKNLT